MPSHNHFYLAIETWGGYDFVASPADRDLVFELRFLAPAYCEKSRAPFQPQLDLNIFDAQAHFLVWTRTEPVEGEAGKPKWLRNFDQGREALREGLKKISGPTARGN